jgi:hypothetical protein
MKYNVKFACGHTSTVELFGKTAERERKIAFYEKNYLCPDCYKDMKEEEKKLNCMEMEMSYKEYKESYPECTTKAGSYDAKDKTIVVYVPELTTESEEEKDESSIEIKGIGFVKKDDAMSILTREGKEAVKRGEITLEELGKMYKLELIKKTSKVGCFGNTFRESYKWIPDDLKDELTPGQLAELTDAFHECYGAGKNDKRED